MGAYANIISLVLILAVFYFMIIRPQKKRQNQQKQMMENLKTGNKVVTIGGINGTIVAIDTDTVVIATGDGEDTTLVMSKASISQVIEGENKAILEKATDVDEEEYEDDDDYEDDDEYEEDDDDDDDEEDEEDDDEDEDETENKQTSK